MANNEDSAVELKKLKKGNEEDGGVHGELFKPLDHFFAYRTFAVAFVFLSWLRLRESPRSAAERRIPDTN
ncbi:hypothetical protein Tco_0765888 [Tanacetum coccineum]